MYRTDFWTLWEKARVEYFKRAASKHILSRVKQITIPGWIHETSARTWCTGKTQRDWVERKVGGGSGWGIHVYPWLIHVNVWKKPLYYCKVISLQLIKKKKKNTLANTGDIGDSGFIPGLGRAPGGGHSYPLQYSCLENSMDRGAWRAIVHRVTKN